MCSEITGISVLLRRFDKACQARVRDKVRFNMQNHWFCLGVKMTLLEPIWVVDPLFTHHRNTRRGGLVFLTETRCQ